MSEEIEPTTRELLWGDSVEVLCFGEPLNWSLRGMSMDENENFNPGILDRLRSVLDRHRIGRLYLPSPKKFNAELARQEELNVSWMDGLLFRGAYAEGVALEKVGEAVGIASSDCPTIIARNVTSLLTVAAHAGRESLYDQAALLEAAKPRRYASVVDAVMATLTPNVSDAKRVLAHVACGIRSVSFPHQVSFDWDGARNARMLQHLRERWGADCVSSDGEGRIDLHEIIRRQFRAAGVPDERLSEDGRDTHEDRSLTNGHLWHSNRREKNGERNFVIAIRRK
jgi:copper oxidase (laccase) domain-containing protein